ncbi:hypothetical protein ZHAS_00012701 [Anopheles sinensis]|uniref:Uncharacterized protein n=1 Tax=Anopheles sinensis TaxID=74873 RepID=A0A084W3K0_ANOSI|nr:hypothetical protein ZHAS_00012701 [Anopheles sinensis]
MMRLILPTHNYANAYLPPKKTHGMQRRGSQENHSWQHQQHHQYHRHEDFDEDEHEADEEDDDHQQCDRSSSSPSPSVDASSGRYHRSSVSGVAPLERSAPPPPAGGFDYHRSIIQPPTCDRGGACVSSVVRDGSAYGPAGSGSSSSPLSETFRGDYCANNDDDVTRDTASLLSPRDQPYANASVKRRERQQPHVPHTMRRHVQFQIAKSSSSTLADHRRTQTVGRAVEKCCTEVGPLLRKVRKKRRKIPHGTDQAHSVPQQLAPGGQPTASHPMKLSKAYLYTARSRREGFLAHRDVVYNGTFPIDMPFCSRFKDYNYSGESSDSPTPLAVDGGSDDGAGAVPRDKDTIDEGIRSYFEGKDFGSLRRRSVAGRSGDRSVLTYAIDEPF